jgi:iron-sulfur cluster repair protein YtfE (RIC family)
MTGDGNPYADTRDMYTVHAMFRREFALLPGLVQGVADRDTGRARVVGDHVRLVNTVLYNHHNSEDAVLWPRIRQRASKDVDPVVQLLEGQHHGLDLLIEELGTRLDSWTGSADRAEGAELAAVLQRLAAGLYEHMGLEEKLALPLVERHIFATEWEAMVAAGAAHVPPEIGPTLVGMLMYEGGIDVVPPEMRDALADLAPKAYAVYCEHLHGTATPPRSTEVGLGVPYVGVRATAGGE